MIHTCFQIVLTIKDNSRSNFVSWSTVDLLLSEEADTICGKVSLTLQNSKPSKDNLSKNERKTLKELKSDTSIVVLPAEKGRSPLLSLTVMTTSKMYGSCKQWSISIT